MKPQLSEITRTGGVADQISYTVTTAYPGEDPRTITFTSTRHGGPVLMTHPTWGTVRVVDPQRFGEFSPEWVRRFFGY